MKRFSFNLLPEKPKAVLEKEEKRETNSLYLAFLPLVSVIIGIGLMLFNTLVIEVNLNKWKDAIAERDQVIQTYKDNLQKNLEFVRKTELLASPVENDVEPEKFFGLSEAIEERLAFNTVIKKYARNSNSTFEFVYSITDKDNIGNLIAGFETLEGVVSPNASTILLNNENDIDVSIEFFIQENEL